MAAIAVAIVRLFLSQANGRALWLIVSEDFKVLAQGISGEDKEAVLARFVRARRLQRCRESRTQMTTDHWRIVFEEDEAPLEEAACPDCNGRGTYVGLVQVETCQRCAGRRVV